MPDRGDPFDWQGALTRERLTLPLERLPRRTKVLLAMTNVATAFARPRNDGFYLPSLPSGSKKNPAEEAGFL